METAITGKAMEETTQATERRTNILSSIQAGRIQKVHAEYNCELVELGLIDSMTARVVIEGTATDIDELLEATK